MTKTIDSDQVAGDQIRAFIERLERLKEEIDALNGDVKEIYAEARGNGFDTKVLKKVLQIRKQDHNERMEQDALLELYLTALGMSEASADEEDAPRARARARAREEAHA